MGTEVEKRTPVEVVCATIAADTFKAKIQQAVPPGMAVERFTRTTLTAIQQNPEVVTADRASLYNAVIRAAQDGLLPDGREAALVIFNTKDGKKVQYLPMIGGLRKRAAEHGFAIDAFLVHEHDDFHYELGFEPVVHHVPPRLGDDRGQVIGAYAVATRLLDGRKFLEPPMSVAEIEAIRGRSRAKDKGPWVTDWGEMARKTVARRLFKSLPLVPDDLVGRTLDAADSEFESRDGRRMTVAEANVAAAIGPVGPPPDVGPDDTLPGDPDVIDGHAVLVEESEEEPETPAAPDVVAEAPASVAPAATPPGEPGSSSDVPPAPDAAATPTPSGASPEGNDGVTGAGDAQGSIFEQKAAQAQAKRQRQTHKDPAA